MLQNDSPSITLDGKDQEKITLVNNRLKAVQSEVLEITKQLSDLEGKYAETLKNVEYYESRIETLTSEVEGLETRKQTLISDIAGGEEALAVHKTQHDALTEAHHKNMLSLDEREKAIAQAEEAAQRNTLDAASKLRLVDEEKKKVDSAKDLFHAATAAVTW